VELYLNQGSYNAFNHCCISFNLLLAFESAKHPPTHTLFFCVELHLEKFGH